MGLRLWDFCATNDPRQVLHAPFYSSGNNKWLCATDGQWLAIFRGGEEATKRIEMEHPRAVEDKYPAPNVDYIFKPEWFGLCDSTIVGDLSIPESARCDICAGTGVAKCTKCGSEIVCKECMGNGCFRKYVSVTDGAGAVDLGRLRRLLAEPTARFRRVSNCLQFVYDSEDGTIEGLLHCPKHNTLKQDNEIDPVVGSVRLEPLATKGA